MAVEAIFCLGCDYPLGALASSCCPECGLDFDLEDAGTFRRALVSPTTAISTPAALALLISFAIRSHFGISITDEFSEQNPSPLIFKRTRLYFLIAMILFSNRKSCKTTNLNVFAKFCNCVF